jgi:hypothetical protein
MHRLRIGSLLVADQAAQHVFVSYVHEDANQVDGLCRVLEAAEIPYWRDRKSLAPGDAWKQKIRAAIRSGSLLFLACFSEASRARDKSFMNEELTIAVEEYRQMPPGRTWLIPVRFDDGPIPEWDLGAGRTFQDINHVDLFGPQHAAGAAALVGVIGRVMGNTRPNTATALAAVEELADEDRPAMLRKMTKEMVPDPARRIELDDLLSREANRIVTAMRDEERFPTQNLTGSEEEQIVALASLAGNYWQLVEPFCYSLQVAARWADPTTLQPWSSALRAICYEAIRPKGGNTALIDLQHIPGLAATFTGALACTGQARWDNLKTLLVDTTVPVQYENRQTPIVVAVHPWQPFKHAWELTPHTFARSVIKNEDLSAALAVFTRREVGRYLTPVPEWLHAVLRPIFDEQFLDDVTYDSAFDRTEAFLGLLSEDQEAARTAQNPNRMHMPRSMWIGRSTWRAANDHGNAVQEITEEKMMYGPKWAPLQAGLFGGDEDRADAAIALYTDLFKSAMTHHF